MSHSFLTRARDAGVLGWPSTPRGRLSVKLFSVAFVLAVVMMFVMGLWFGVFEDAPGEQESPPVWVLVPLVAAFLTAAASALSGGVLAIMGIRQGDRSGLLFLPFAAALTALTFFVGEVAIPH